MNLLLMIAHVLCCPVETKSRNPVHNPGFRAPSGTRHPKRVRSMIFPAMRHIGDVLADVLRGLAPALVPETTPEAPPHNARPAPASSPRPDARVSPSLCRILP